MNRLSLIGFRLLKSSDKAVHFGSSDIMFSLECRSMACPPLPAMASTSHFRPLTGKPSDAFHEAAIANSATDEGTPGIRETTTLTIMERLSEILMETRLEAVTFTARETF
ncbi:hypothetical protein [Bradyrhizobium sp. URHC0002]